jgi:TRAP-type C4-dicarboxylate transport system permease large subunit
VIQANRQADTHTMLLSVAREHNILVKYMNHLKYEGLRAELTAAISSRSAQLAVLSPPSNRLLILEG